MNKFLKAVGGQYDAYASLYKAARPSYPAALFDAIAAASPARKMAVEVGCGSGQATSGLAQHFAKVIATDPSREQLKEARQAIPDAHVDFRACAAEHIDGVADGAADLIASFQALHWFDFEAYFNEVRRVLRPDGGLLVAVTYNLIRVGDDNIDELIRRIYAQVRPYFDDRRVFVDNSYSGIDFPFENVELPPFSINQLLTRDAFRNYVHSWSGSQAYMRQHDEDPLKYFNKEIASLWGEEERAVYYPLTVIARRRRRQA